MTLSDLLVSTALVGVLTAGMLVAFEQSQQAWAVGAARVEIQHSGRAALTWLTSELRWAGYGTDPESVAALSIAEPTRLRLHVDRNRDGVVAGSGESVTWLLRGDVLRREAGGGAQPVIRGVRDLAFAYFDARGRPVTDPAAVRHVHITLTTRPNRALLPVARGLTATITTEVRLRNR